MDNTSKKEGWLEKHQRMQGEARMNAGIAELRRRIAAGEFPDNDDTVTAFSAGFFSAYQYQRDQYDTRQEGMNAHLAAFASALLGFMMVGFYGIILYLDLPTNDGSWLLPFVGIFLLNVAFFAFRRSRRQVRAAEDAHNTKWGDA